MTAKLAASAPAALLASVDKMAGPQRWPPPAPRLRLRLRLPPAGTGAAAARRLLVLLLRT
jgi:hypothetical protein